MALTKTSVRTFFGPPGCGKTHTLLERMVEQLEAGIDPRDIGYTAFTRVAADVARARASTIIGVEPDDLRWFGTLHALCGRLLNFDWRGGLLTETGKDETGRRGRALYEKFGRDEGFPFDFLADVDAEADAFTGEGSIGNQLLSWYHWTRQCGYDVETGIVRWRAVSTTTLKPEEQRRFVLAYEDFKQDMRLRDFTDILVMADAQAVCPPVSVLIIDEAQDLSPLQWRILDRWRSQIPTVFLGGDDDQAIYAWQGADAKLFLSRAGEGEITTLGQSYRLPRASWALATRLSSHIRVRQDKPFAPQDRAGVACERAIGQTPVGQDGSWFILARNNRLLKHPREELERAAIPYSARRGFDPSQMYYPAARAITALARGHNITHDSLAALARYLEPDVAPGLQNRLKPRNRHELPRTITAALLPELGFSAPWCERLATEPIPVRMLSFVSSKGYRLALTWNYLVRLQQRYGDVVFTNPPRVVLSTIHGVKGDEADHVILLTDMARASLRTLQTDPDSEHRVWYVGATRAKQSLYIVPPTTPTYYAPLVSGGWKGVVEAS